MCPNCIKGLKNGELCEQCKGTGFWNPESLPVNEAQNMEHDTETTVAADSVAREETTSSEEAVELAPTDVAPVETTETAPEGVTSVPVEIPATPKVSTGEVTA